VPETPVVLLGSAAIGPAGCACRACLAGSPSAPAALRVGELTVSGSTVRTAGSEPVGIAPGEGVEHGGVRIVGLPTLDGEPALVLAGRGTGTVLWSPGAAPLDGSAFDALRGADLEVAALGAGPDGRALPRALALLRRVGALAPGCDVVAVGVEHTTPPDRLAEWLPRWGARLAPDGTPLGRAHAASPRTPPRRTVVLGPTSSGKSAYAEALLAAEPDVDYLPTGPAPTPDDTDWAARVAGHRDRRPGWWRTLESVTALEALAADGPPLLLDSLGTWVSGTLERCGAWDDAPGWEQAFETEVDTVVGAWRQVRRQVVAVGEETGWGVVPATSAGRRFRDALGRVNRRLAAESERVVLVVAGRACDLTEGVPDV
jgi:adenosylcobinamide kinase/adenosylcobinamide-phosphate guanylyltransferase